MRARSSYFFVVWRTLMMVIIMSMMMMMVMDDAMYIHRYLDLFIRFIGLYNFLMKIFYIGSAAGIIYYMRFHKVRQ